MKRYLKLLPSLLIIMIASSSCELVGDIFRTGFWFGVLTVVGLLVLMIWVFSKANRKKG